MKPSTARVTISLPADMREYVERQVEARGHGSVDDYFQSLIKRDEIAQSQEPDCEPECVERALLEGLNSGPSVAMTPEDWREIRQEVARRVRGRGGL